MVGWLATVSRTSSTGAQLSKSKSRGGFCSNQSRSCSGVSWRKSGVSSSTSSSPSLRGAGSAAGGACSAAGGASTGSIRSSSSHGCSARLRLGRGVRLRLGRGRGLGVEHHRGGRRRRRLGRQLLPGRDLRLRLRLGAGLGELPAAGIAERLVLLACDLVEVGPAAALELQVLADCVVEQSHQYLQQPTRP